MRHKKTNRLLLFLAAFTLVIVAFLVAQSRAATGRLALEPEDGASSGALSVLPDGGAGGSSFVRFGEQQPDPALTYYVSPAGSSISKDRNAPGSVTETIKAICGQVPAGAHILFLDGVYRTKDIVTGANEWGNRQAITLSNKNCGSDSAYITLKSLNRHGAKIDATYAHNGFLVQTSNHIAIRDFEVYTTDIAGTHWGTMGLDTRSSHHILVFGLKIHDFPAGGLGGYKSTRLRYENNEVFNTSSRHIYCASGVSFFEMQDSWGLGAHSDGYANYIINNHVHDNQSNTACDADANASNGTAASDGNCIILDLHSTHGYTAKTLIANNICANNGGAGIHMYQSGHADVIGNTLYRDGHMFSQSELSAFCTWGSHGAVRFMNNVVVARSSGQTVKSHGAGSCFKTVSFNNNLFIEHRPSGIALTTDIASLRNCASASNGYVGSLGAAGLQGFSSGIYESSLSSLSTDTGSCSLPDSAPLNHDFIYRQRPHGSTPDSGAYEAR